MTRRWVGAALALWLFGSAPGWAQCAGDCDEDGTVGVDELVLSLTLALDGSDADRCAAVDTNVDGEVGADEILVAVNNGLSGCAMPGSYSATVELDGGATGMVDLTVAADGQASGTVMISDPGGLRLARGLATSIDVSGQVNLATGSFLITGTFARFNVRISGRIGGAFTLEINGQVYSSSFVNRPRPTRTPTPTQTPSGTVHTVKVGQPVLPFDPEFLEINPGDTVVWMWVAGPHSVRSAVLNQIGQPLCTSDGRFDSGPRSSGMFSFTFTTPGRYGYHCNVGDHCESFENGVIEVRGTPTATPTRTWTRTHTVAIPTATPTPELIGGVSTRMLGTFSGTAKIGTQTLPARLRIEVINDVVIVTDISSPAPFLFPNPVQMSVVSPTSLLYELAGPPPTRIALSLNAEGHVVGRYSVDDPIMPHLPVDYDVTRES